MLRRDFLGGAAAALAGLIGLKRGAQAKTPKRDDPFTPGVTNLGNGWMRTTVLMQAGAPLREGDMVFVGPDGKAYPVGVVVTYTHDDAISLPLSEEALRGIGIVPDKDGWYST